MYSLTENTLITLVLYHCNLENSDAYKTLIEANKEKKLHVLIYNNSPEFKIEQPINTNHQIEIIHDNSNAGVSKAYNYGANKAKELNRSTGGWGFFGFVSPIIAMIWINCLKPITNWDKN